MIWRDNLVTNGIPFEDLKVGEGFENNGTLYVKFSDDCAFDIINNKGSFFKSTAKVTPRDCEIIFH